MIGPDLAEFRRSAPIADDRTFPVGLPVAEPLQQDLLPRNLVKPRSRLDVLDVSLSNQQSFLAGVVVDRIRHRRWLLRNRSRRWNTRHSLRWQSRGVSGSPSLRINHALAERMEPDDRASNFNYLGENIPITCDRDSEAGCREIFLKA